MAFLGGVRIAAWTDSEIFSAFRCRASDHKEVFVGGLTGFHCGGVKPAPVYHHHHHHHATINSFSGEGQGLKRAWCGNSRIQQQGVAMKALKSFNETDQVPIPLLRGLLSAMVKPYLIKNPTAMTALDLIRTHVGGPLCYDHFAFRTFGVNGCGIDSMSQVFLDLGYEVRDELRFPAKKVWALWFSPPKHLLDMEGSEADGPLPRIFISELIVNELSLAAQEIIHKYTSNSAPLAKHAAAASILNSLTWPTPQLTDYQTLAKESEYAAWTLVNGYALNHTTVSVHRLGSLHKIGKLNEFLQENGIRLNSEGGILKVSPDGGLQQSSSVADTITFTFAGGEEKRVPASYIEFAERLVLPIYSDLHSNEIHEWHRRDGFEVGNADKIFESTSSDQIGMHAS
ncbi:unnamed protein product [Sphagnum jensenii]|uniref:2-oxoadipate dioxygenase/decarboxylase n=1 Tax=Sphagnum jensenii TaxID=128206 RepID=A0ABP0W8S0_9BRYO